MRIAWFSPFPPVRSGISAYSAELVPRLSGSFVIDSYPESAAHDFVWRQRRHPYDLVVYQLGNAPCHDYMWAYLVRYPGVVILHDARLHHARARRLLRQERVDDYRREFRYDHPDANQDFVEYARLGLRGNIYYFWSMLRVVMATARTVAVHSAPLADDLRADYRDTPVETIRMGVPAIAATPDARTTIRRACGWSDRDFVFAAFGKVTAEKRIPAILKALDTLAADRRANGGDARLLLVGDADGYPLSGSDRVHVAGHVDDERIGDYLAASDACLCLRWPTAQESSASWLRCLASARPTVITDLAHLVDVPANVALRVDLLDEDASLASAMRRLMEDGALRTAIARDGHAFWAAHHTLDAMAEDYRRLLPLAASRPAPSPADLPRHFVDDHSTLARTILDAFGQSADWLT